MQPDQDQGLVTIERTVAFVLGPIVVAGSGLLSSWLATKCGIKIGAEEITGIFATGGLMAGALVWKWLHGRQLSERVHIENAPALENAETLAHRVAEIMARDISGKPGASPPDELIPPAANDPAPVGQVADAGAASGQ